MPNDSTASSSLRDADRMVTPSLTDFAVITKSITFNVPVKLNRDNYVYWKARVLLAIEAFDLDDFISGLKLIPAKFIEIVSSNREKETVINKEFTSWRKAERLLVCWLLSTISPSIIGEVTSCATSCEVWNVLKNLYSQQSLTKVLQLKQQQQNAKKGSSSMSEFMLRIKGIGNVLKGAGEDVKDNDLLLSILNGIGHEYDPIVVLTALQKHTMTIQKTQYMLIYMSRGLIILIPLLKLIL
ncbi:hypothetical protein ACOSQ2_023742 [Xanthoceras sorbifolium]